MTNETRDKIKTWAAIIPFILLAIGGYIEMRENIVALTSRVDSVTASNERTVEVFEKLADSVNRLSESVARLDERTKALENE